MSVAYNKDIIAWANEQAALIRARRFDLLDIEHIAEEIEDVGKSEQRELESRMAVLIAHLLKWQFQPTHRGVSWELTIKDQRRMVSRRLKQTPSLKASLLDTEWIDDAWADATIQATKETGVGRVMFPKSCPWTMEQVLDDEFFPD